MPEGDTIYRTAVTLSRVLLGKAITKCISYVADVRPEYLEGKIISKVDSQGKNLLIHFNNGYVLHTHMRMSGSWHIYRIEEKWRRPGKSARLVLEVKDFQAVCFNAPIVRLLTSAKRLAGLGPDALKPDEWDPALIRERFRQYPGIEIGDALLNQQLFAGIGNIYKNESLFLERISPFDPIQALSDATLERLIAKAASLMANNLNLNRRASPYWVYKRKGKPCRVCGETICMRRQGNYLKSTYYCPGCQKPLPKPDVLFSHESYSEP